MSLPEAGPAPSGVDLAAPERGVQLEIGPFELEAHTETYWCKITRLPNEQPLDIVALEHQASPSAHHFNVWGLAVAPDVDVEGPCDQVWAHTSGRTPPGSASTMASSSTCRRATRSAGCWGR